MVKMTSFSNFARFVNLNQTSALTEDTWNMRLSSKLNTTLEISVVTFSLLRTLLIKHLKIWSHLSYQPQEITTRYQSHWKLEIWKGRFTSRLPGNIISIVRNYSMQ